MIVENTQPRLLTLPSCIGGRIDELVGKQLPPGESDVSTACWENAKKKRAVKAWVKLGVLVEKGEGKASPLVSQEEIENMEILKKEAKGKSAQELKKLLKETKSRDGKAYIRALIDKEIAK